MKVLMVNKFLYPNGGSETYMFKLGEYLQTKGHRVEYFGMEHEGRTVGNSVNAYTTDMDFHGGSKLSNIFLPLKTIYSFEARKQIRKVLDNFQPDVVHINNFNYQLTPSIIVEIVKWRKKNNKKCKIIYTAHDGQLVCPNHLFKNPNTNEICEKCIDGKCVNCFKGKCVHGSSIKSLIGTMEAYYWKWRKIYKNIDTIICCSEFMKTKLDHDPILAEKTIALHNFVDEVEWKETDKKDYVVYFGRYSEEKGIGTLIEACKELPDIKFIFAGVGPMENQLNDVDNIQNVGFQMGMDLERIIREARFSINPSECYENCPFSVLESQMFGTPVLGADIGGIPELVQVGVTGDLFESSNKDELKKKIQYLYNNKSITDEYSKNCKKSSFNNLEKYYSRIINYYS